MSAACRSSFYPQASRPLFLVALFWLLLLAVPARAQAPEARYQPRYNKVPCRLNLPAGAVRLNTIQCGYLRVPEDRRSGRGVVQLAVVRLVALSENPLPDPIVYLAGGPGGNASGRLDEWFASPLRADRDIYLIDQRGTGFSRPSMNCDRAFGNSVESWAQRCLRDPVSPRCGPQALHQPRQRGRFA